MLQDGLMKGTDHRINIGNASTGDHRGEDHIREISHKTIGLIPWIPQKDRIQKTAIAQCVLEGSLILSALVRDLDMIAAVVKERVVATNMNCSIR